MSVWEIGCIIGLGNSLGVIDPLEFLSTLRRLTGPQDLVLVDGEIFIAHSTMSGYDNPTNRRFAFAPLASIGLEEDRDGTLVFESTRDPRLEGLHLVSKHFLAARRLDIPLAGERLTLAAGEKIAMNCSYKYSRDAFRRIVSDHGFALHGEYISHDERFVMVLAAPGTP